MSPWPVICSNCGQKMRLNITEEHVGRKLAAKCPECKTATPTTVGAITTTEQLELLNPYSQLLDKIEEFFKSPDVRELAGELKKFKMITAIDLMVGGTIRHDEPAAEGAGASAPQAETPGAGTDKPIESIDDMLVDMMKHKHRRILH